MGSAAGNVVPAARVVHVGGDVGDIMHHAGLDEGLELEVILSGMALVAHLGDHVRVLERYVDEELVLEERTAHRLFTIDVDAFLDGTHGDREMGEVGRGYEHRFDLGGHLVEHLAEVLVLGNARELGDGPLGMRRSHVDVAKCDDVDHFGPHDLRDVVLAPVADADEGDLDLFGWG